MDTNIARLPAFKASASSWINVVGICIEIFGVFIIVAASSGLPISAWTGA